MVLAATVAVDVKNAVTNLPMPEMPTDNPEGKELPVHRIYRMPGHLIRRLHQIAVALFTEATKEIGVTPIQYAALAVAESYPGIDQRRLANLIAFDRSTIGDVVQRLEQRGWLRREGGSSDRRTKSVFLTAEGRAVLKRLDEVVLQSQLKILAPLSDGEQAILDVPPGQTRTFEQRNQPLSAAHSRRLCRARSNAALSADDIRLSGAVRRNRARCVFLPPLSDKC